MTIVREVQSYEYSYEYCYEYYTITVSFHNFKSQNFKLSVSNPKNKYVAYLSVLSQISNCQGLGRKNTHEVLKTDRMIMRVHNHVCVYIYIERERER